MKLFRKKFVRGTILLFLSFFVISTCCITISSAMRVNEENKLNSSNFYSQNSRRFSIVETEDDSFWNDLFHNTQEKDYIIYNLIWDEDIDIRAIYINEKMTTPKIISGRFFEESDILGKSSTAVIGKSRQGETINKDGKDYYIYNDNEYEVIGVMGTERDSRVNEMIFLDFYSGMELNTSNGSYVVDAKSSKAVNAVLTDLESTIFGKTGNIYISAEEVATGVDRIFSDQNITQTLYGLILFCFLFSTMIVAILWVSYRRNLIAVKMMLGYSNWLISFDLLKSYFKISMVAYLISLIFVFTIQISNNLLQLQWQDLLLSILTTLLFGTISFICPLIKIIRTNVIDVMR